MESAEADALAAQLAELRALVTALSDEDFALPTRCPGWSVAELVAHCEGMLLRLVGENSRAVDGEPETDRVGYYRYDPDGPREDEDPGKTFSDVVRDRVVDEARGRDAADLRAGLDEGIDRALSGIRELPADRVIQRSGHPRMTFGEFVAARNLEFGVHTMDIAHATGRPERVHPNTERVIVGMLDGLLGEPVPVALGWDGTTYILTGTGRRPLADDERAALGPLATRFPLLR
jgi:uncharacterized protein (TIGR03083 family)